MRDCGVLNSSAYCMSFAFGERRGIFNFSIAKMLLSVCFDILDQILAHYVIVRANHHHSQSLFCC